MALYGVLADIHGNHEALAAALAYLDARGARRYLCLGDLVGYNADADRCVAEVRERGMETVAGNHDLISIGRLGFQRCARRPAHALRRTRRRLQPATTAYLGGLAARRALEGGVVLIHGGVDDVELYMRTPAQVAHNGSLLSERCPGARICFYGHTHEAAVWELGGEGPQSREAAGTVRLRADRTYFVNPGSVDSARKPQPGRAECALFDPEAGTVEFASVPYDHEAAERKARGGGYRVPEWSRRLRRALRLR
jgi:predicted phosphodiesterase